jgi:predicted ATP-dependent endonuclease of OLD family
LFIATHSNLISARLNLRKCVLLNSNTTDFALLDSLPVDTADFFMKAPDNNILEFILSKKVILVEGDAEYILAAAFFEKETGLAMESADVHVISVDGTSFKRYLDLAKLLKIRTAVIRDNDHNFQLNCVERYTDFVNDHIQVFADENDDMHTFEISLYAGNATICDELFAEGRRTLSVEEYMVKNKTDAALALLKTNANTLIIPQYFRKAIQWIRQ